jgi:hypothetical protein
MKPLTFQQIGKIAGGIASETAMLVMMFPAPVVLLGYAAWQMRHHRELTDVGMVQSVAIGGFLSVVMGACTWRQ